MLGINVISYFVRLLVCLLVCLFFCLLGFKDVSTADANPRPIQIICMNVSLFSSAP